MKTSILNIKKTIGRLEKINFPELGIYGIDAKVDTGAYSTAIHCHDIQIREINDMKTLCFKLLDPTHIEYNRKEIQFQNYELKSFRNSFGIKEERYVIKTLIKLGNRKVRGTVSLTDRANMRFPVLIGRKFLKNYFLVDVSSEYLLQTIISKTKK